MNSSVWARVSVQVVKSLGVHFACLCRRFDYYEVKRNIIIIQKEKGNTFTNLTLNDADFWRCSFWEANFWQLDQCFKHSHYLKMCVSQNWTNLEKHPSFPQFSSKLSKCFFGERSDKSGFFISSKLLRAYFFG